MDDMWFLVSEDPEKTFEEVAPHAYYQISTYAQWAADLEWGFPEMDFETFKHELLVKYWPGPDQWHLLAEAQAHGAWINWLGD